MPAKSKTNSKPIGSPGEFVQGAIVKSRVLEESIKNGVSC
jgi:hypothetical protein